MRRADAPISATSLYKNIAAKLHARRIVQPRQKHANDDRSDEAHAIEEFAPDNKHTNEKQATEIAAMMKVSDNHAVTQTSRA
jgi:hypothetical protein